MTETSNIFETGKGKLAVTVREFTLKKTSEFFLDRYSEPYIVSLAADSRSTRENNLEFNVLSFPNIRAGDTVRFDGQGHLIYGPEHPGDFLAYTILFMESDTDYRNTGEMLSSVLKKAKMAGEIRKVFQTGKAEVIYQMVLKLGGMLAEALKKDRDDELFRRSGTLLRDVHPPYDILRTYTSENDFIRASVSIIPLERSHSLGSSPQRVEIS